jgi:hypothetical protein
MRILIVALGLAAMATTPALAQVARGSVSGPTIGTSSTGANNTTGTTTTTTSGTNTTSGTSTLATGTSLPGGVTNPGQAAPASTTASGTSAVAGGGVNNASGTNQSTDINAATPGNSFGPGGSFANDSGNTALGTSPGQTSSGTFAGNSSAGIGADSSTLNTFNNGLATSTGNPTLVPEGAVSVIGGGSSGARVVGVPNAVSPQGTGAGSTPTPLFDQAAREGRAKEARRRARGEEPRVYGIAPNTERDLTHQMPDDRIIRY